MEETLNEFVSKLRQCWGDDLISVVLHGSFARTEARTDRDQSYSDLNLICVLRTATAYELRECAEALEWWRKKKQPPPLVLSLNDVRTRTDVFPIEYIDILENHRILYGKNLFEGMTVDRANHRAEVEHEISSNLIRLRQKYLLLHKEPKEILRLMIESAPAFGTMARHALMLAGASAPSELSEIFDAAEKRFSLNAAPFLRILRVRRSGDKVADSEINELFGSYLDQVTKLERIVDEL